MGAGPAGIAVALGLVDSGLRVVVVESGGLEESAASQELAQGEVSGLPYGPLEGTRVRAFGGTSRAWGHAVGGMEPMEEEGRRTCGRSRPLTSRSDHGWSHSGWPIRVDDLAGYYEAASELTGTGSSNYGLDGLPLDLRHLPVNSDRMPAVVFRYGMPCSS